MGSRPVAVDGTGRGGLDHDRIVPPAPAAADPLDRLREDLLLLDLGRAPEVEVVVAAGPCRRHDVEPGDVAAAGAAEAVAVDETEGEVVSHREGTSSAGRAGTGCGAAG